MRRRFLVVCAVVVAVPSLTTCAHATRVAHPAAPGAPVLEVMTWNVNYGAAPDVSVLEHCDADVVVLQETTPEWEPALAGLARWPHRAVLRAPAAGGMAVISRRPLLVREALDNPDGWFKALRVVTSTPLGPVQLLVVHLHPPVTEDGSWVQGFFGTDEVREAELKTFMASLDPALPTVVAGDFNESRGAAVRRLEAHGLRTALPEFDPKAKTWRWPVGPLLLTGQFDHLAYDASLEPLDVRVLKVGESDHFPVVGAFVRAPRGAVRPPLPQVSALSVSVH